MAATTRSATASTQYAHKYVHAIFAAETSAGAATVTLRDGGASGTILMLMNVKAGDNAGLSLNEPMFFADGVYVAVTGGARFTLVAE